jgi:ABC-type transport system involved in cytochrome bd biosynthesis fused ATPase/permease subunit
MHDFIMARRAAAPQVGEHGRQVAGGERQRIAVARAPLMTPQLSCLTRRRPPD